MCEVSYDGHTLRAKGTNKVGHIALLGEDSKHLTELVLTRDQFEVEKFKTGNVAINGNLVLRDTNGRKYQLRFRKKDNTSFEGLASALGVTQNA